MTTARYESVLEALAQVLVMHRLTGREATVVLERLIQLVGLAESLSSHDGNASPLCHIPSANRRSVC